MEPEKQTVVLDAAPVTARAEYQKAVVQLAAREAAERSAPDRKPADVDCIHQARTRVIALDAAREELRNTRGPRIG